MRVIMIQLLTGLVLLAGYQASGSAETVPMQFSDHIKIRELGGLAVSPDGGRVAYVVSGRELETNDSWSEVRVSHVQSGKWHKVTVGGKHEGSPGWSPDGKTLAITSDKSEKGQVWLVSADGKGVARQLTTLATGGGSPAFSADGKSVFFTSRVFPHCTDDACNAAKLAEVEKDPVKARVFTKLMYRHWDSWRDGRFSHVFVMPAAGGEARDLMPGDDWGLTGGWELAMKDQCLVFTTKSPADETLTTNHDLKVISMTGEDEECLTGLLTPNEANDSGPVVSPKGDFVAYHAQQLAGFESDRFRLLVRSLKKRDEPRVLSDTIDRWVIDYGWFPKGKKLWFAVLDQGNISVYVTDFKGKKEPRKVLGGAYFTDIGLSPDGKSFYCVRQTMAAPAEVWRFDADGKESMAVTTVNQELAETIDWGDVEEVWWEGANGDKVHGFVLFPPGTARDRKNPFLLLIHGGPQGMWSNRLHPRWNPQLFAAPGYVTLMPNPRGSVGYGQEFTNQISRDWGGRCYEDLMKGVDFMIEKGWADPERMCAGGGSFGGYMANWILGKNNRFKCLISHAGVYDLRSKYGSTDELWFPEWEFGGTPWDSDDYEKWSPSSLVKNFKTPMLVIHGAHDYRVSLNQAFQLFTALQRVGVPSKFLYYPDETHFVVKPKNSELWYAEVHAWLKQWIGK